MDWIPRVTIFHCINSLEDIESLNINIDYPFEIRSVKMPCSGMTKEVYLLKAFEAGADAVIVLMCPEGECRFVEGNIRARKRIERARRLLDEIGIQGDRLSAVSLEPGNEAEIVQMILRTVAAVRELGPNPAADPASAAGPITENSDQDQHSLTFAEKTDDCRRAKTVCGNQKTRMAV